MPPAASFAQLSCYLPTISSYVRCCTLAIKLSNIMMVGNLKEPIEHFDHYRRYNINTTCYLLTKQLAM